MVYVSPHNDLHNKVIFINQKNIATKGKEMVKTEKKPEIAFLFLCDAHELASSNKWNCYGIFNIFNVWDFPALREASFVIYAYNIFKSEKISLTWIDPKGKRKILGKAQCPKSKEPYGFHRIAQHLMIPIKAEGIHFFEGSIGSTSKKIPIIVNKFPWPELSEEEIKKALEDPHSVRSARMEIVCNKCGRKHTFEVHLDPNAKNTPGTIKFPKSGRFKCKTKTCSTIIPTKDIEGRARSLLGKSTSFLKR